MAMLDWRVTVRSSAPQTFLGGGEVCKSGRKVNGGCAGDDSRVSSTDLCGTLCDTDLFGTCSQCYSVLFFVKKYGCRVTTQKGYNTFNN